MFATIVTASRKRPDPGHRAALNRRICGHDVHRLREAWHSDFSPSRGDRAGRKPGGPRKCMAKDERAIRSALIRQAAEALADTRRHQALPARKCGSGMSTDNAAN